MEATHFVKDEHKRIIGLLRQETAALKRAPEMVSGIRREIIMELEVYLQIKNEFVYKDMPEDRLNPCMEQDRNINNYIHKMKTLDKRDKRLFGILLTDLMSQVEECFYATEHRLLPLLKNRNGDPLKARQSELMNQPQYRNSRPEVVQNPHGGEQQRKRAA